MKRVICALLAVALALAALPLGVWAYPESTYPTTVNAGSLDLTLAFDQSYMSSPTSMSISLQGGLITERSQVHPDGDADVRAITYDARVSPGQTITLRADGTPHGQSVKSEMEMSILVEQSTVETSERSGNVSYTVQPGDKSVYIRAQFKDYYSHYNNYIFEFTVIYTVVEDAAPAQPANNAPASHPNHPPGSCWLCGGEDSGARFNDLYGEVSYRCDDDEDDGYEYAELDTVLHVNDRIRTREDSGAILQFIDLGTFVIRPESIIVLGREEQPNKFKIIMGKFWINLKKAVIDGVVEVEMAQGVSGKKGTILAGEETGDASIFWLFTSSAEITSKTTGEVLTLAPGQKATVTANNPITVEAFDIEEGAAEFGIPMQTIEADRQENGYLDTEGIDGIVDIEADAAAGKPEDYGDYIPDGAKDDSVLYFAVGLLFILLVLAALVTVVLLVVRAAGKRKQGVQPGAPYQNPDPPPRPQAAPPWQQPPPQNAAPLPPAPQRQYCPRCGVPYRPGAKFCNNCGGPLQ